MLKGRAIWIDGPAGRPKKADVLTSRPSPSIGYTAPFDAERTGNMCAHAAQSANKASTSQSDGAAANACGCRRVAATAVIAVAATQT